MSIKEQAKQLELHKRNAINWTPIQTCTIAKIELIRKRFSFSFSITANRNKSLTFNHVKSFRAHQFRDDGRPQGGEMGGRHAKQEYAETKKNLNAQL